jgi:phenylalanyl-tRNA synthetase beta subunit
VKGVVETLAGAFGLELEFEPAEIPYLEPGTSADVSFRLKPDATQQVVVASAFRRKIGVVGQIARAIAEARGLPAGEPLWAFELDADALDPATTATICARSRCRAFRRSCGISRSSSRAACLPPRFVALSARRLLRRSCT